MSLMNKLSRFVYSNFVTIVAFIGVLLIAMIFNIVLCANASNAPQLSQVVTAGTLATAVRDENGSVVGSPSYAMSSRTFSFDCQSGGLASTGTLGANTQRIYVDNPGAANNGWTLTIAATGGATALWQNGGSTQNYDFNDSGGSGCTDGVDADSRGGQMTLNPAAGTITTDCLTCAATNITKGSQTAFAQGTTDSITLLNAAAGSDDVWIGYLTGVTISQTLPAEQFHDSYTLSMTLTATAQ